MGGSSINGRNKDGAEEGKRKFTASTTTTNILHPEIDCDTMYCTVPSAGWEGVSTKKKKLQLRYNIILAMGPVKKKERIWLAHTIPAM